MKASTCLVYFLLCTLTPLLAQQTYRVHAHNDYVRDVPFWHAYGNGAESIEVDLYLERDTLFATHSRAEIASGATFSALYLEELDRLAERVALRPVQLLIDLKSEAYETLDEVVAAIQRYPKLTESGQVTFVISGNRPEAADYGNYPDFIYFDHQRLDDLGEIDLDKVALISQSFRDYSVWNGYGRITSGDGARVQQVLATVAPTGKPFRFWATPDTKTAWAYFAGLGVGYINTDRPAPARAFLDQLPQRTYRLEQESPVYEPSNNFDPNARARNVILLIGDGNGLSQISAARVANGGDLSLTRIKHVGLVSTTAADDAVTDSAAGGTAMATGEKTNNRSIGVDTAGGDLPTLVELLGREGYTTGIITTDGIDGATPSAFYAHTAERDDSDKIIADLVASDLDFFIAGGAAKADRIAERYQSRSLEDIGNLDRPTAIYHGAGKMPSVEDGRGDFLPASVDTALSVLGRTDRPFFLLVEGAQIDSGGHANDITTVVTEMLDFDRAVARALRFADTDRETLVIVTADHETGGLGVATGTTNGSVRADFLSVDHTGTLVPLFAYGPGAAAFTGVFENTEVFHRIMAALAGGE
ncbi:alkaline phosphatase [Neolewinella xylanilytica]|uniref:Alkaline phosphatase n=1 Tax=Neolewinella xylanilytica TaxID=1514080 RepID=A0A2S6I839_9BACT|nr:alkaline phosphatase [Neolewinella xylanilytica]PPK87655.1 alkaline phosphatase [Neolewinella xylanilytica]